MKVEVGKSLAVFLHLVRLYEEVHPGYIPAVKYTFQCLLSAVLFWAVFIKNVASHVSSSVIKVSHQGNLHLYNIF